MIRITHLQGDNTVARLRVEGWITQGNVGELNLACAVSLTDHRTLLLDLRGVRFVDAAGIDMLSSRKRRGAVLIRCSGFLTESLRIDTEDERSVPEPVDADEHVREAELLTRLRYGENEAFEHLVRQYGGWMLTTARRLLGTEHDAQDAVQDAFLSAFKAINQFTGAAKLSTWLYRIVVNAALMKLRSRCRRPEESIEDLLPRFDEQGEWASRMSHWDTPSDVLLQRQETRALVRRCIDCLPQAYRTVLLLRDIEELNTEETAAALGITPNAVKIRLHRARQALRTLLKRELIGETAGTAAASNPA